MIHAGLRDTWSSWTDRRSPQSPVRLQADSSDAGELNVPKYCVKPGIHTFVCALTTFPSGWKETAQLGGKKRLNCLF